MFAGCSDECIKAIIKAKQGKGVHPYTNPPNPRPRPKRPINLQIKEPISIKPSTSIKPIPKDAIELKKKPIITELNQEKSICTKLELAKKTTDTELYNEKFNKNINTEFEEVNDTELEEVNEESNKNINTELEEVNEESNKNINTELEEVNEESNKNINTELEEEESSEKQSISTELKVDNTDTPKTWYNIPIFSKYFS